MFAEDPECKQFQGDAEAQKYVKNTLKLADVKAADFDAVFYVGGHGPVVDLSQDETSIKLIEDVSSGGCGADPVDWMAR